ncbi:MAG: hypothetical protein IJP92_12285 [Lachnospiraceae bacterium]|nr:hypothetical protein [Lachnospiraceae bacterium]
MGIVKQYHKDTDTVYVYESESFYDPKKKQSRSKRRVIGKIDKETGEIVPTGKRGPKKDKLENGQVTNGGYVQEIELSKRIDDLQKVILMLKSRIKILEVENKKLQRQIEADGKLKRKNDELMAVIGQIRELTK